MTIYLTADLHFGHANIIKYCNRPFANVEEMDETLIMNWNFRVHPEDDVYVVGDFCFGDPRPYVKHLNGNIRFLIGSHDKELAKLGNLVIGSLVTLKTEPNITLCHYAMRSWPASHYGTWHLFGHHHGKLEPYGLSFDVGVDCWDYEPVSLEKVAKKMATLKPIVDFSRSMLA